jgi:hypothetical protein
MRYEIDPPKHIDQKFQIYLRAVSSDKIDNTLICSTKK